MRIPRALLLLFFVVVTFGWLFAQSETATISGYVTDQTGGAMASAQVKLVNVDTNVEKTTLTNNAGLYLFPGMAPGRYRMSVTKDGFKEFVKQGLVLHVQDAVSQNFTMEIGATSQSVTVTAESALLNTTNASVGTVIDRKFIESIPLNGRSFQTLIAMVPGVVMTPVASNGGEQGQFAANGQRTNANYFTVDGVSANFGVPVFQGLSQATSGSMVSTNMQGGFTNLVAADSLQEFKIQTSTFAPEYGRSPGGQVSLVTRSGQNTFHGSLFEYFRNDKTDAKDWFNPQKPPLRFNDFGGTFGGPIWKNKTFFFGSYEGQRFLLPQPPANSAVPSQAARDAAPNAIAKALLGGFPLPNGPVITDATGAATDGAYFNATYSNPTRSDAWSIKIDHNLFGSKVSVFGRYNRAPSRSFSRSTSNFASGSKFVQNTETITVGSNQMLANNLVNEVRLNRSKQDGQWFNFFDGYGGAKLPDSTIFLPPGYADTGARYYIYYFYAIRTASGSPIGLTQGDVALNQTRHWNFVDNLSYNRGKHAFKFGADYRHPYSMTPGNSLLVGEYFTGAMSTVYALTPGMQMVSRSPKTEMISPNFSAYAQDTWNFNRRLTLTYGARWEVNPPPHPGDAGKQLVTLAQAPDLTNLNQEGLQLAPLGTPYYKTSYTKLAPRLGFAYTARQTPGRETVVRAGWGMFYDLASTPFGGGSWPYNVSQISTSNISFPVTAAAIPLPDPNFTPSATNRASSIPVAAPGFTLPRTYQWNLTVEQALGRAQTLSVAYVGAAGRDLLRTISLSLNKPPAPTGAYYSTNFSSFTYVDNGSYSDYNSMQVQFRRTLARGLQGMANYTWSHSTDDNSSVNSTTAPGFIYGPEINHGASAFDIRHNFTSALTYEIPAPKWNRLSEKLFGNWSLNGLVMARSGLPFNITLNETNQFNFYQSIRRPDIVPGQSLIISDPAAPGGWRINNATDSAGQPVAFKAPANNFAQGSLGRNRLYGFGAWQADFGLHRNFKLGEKLGLEFRAEAFNILNHPNFINPNSSISYSQTTGKFTVTKTFGVSPASMASGYNGGGNTGGFNPLFQVGGPRSMQFAMRLTF